MICWKSSFRCWIIFLHTLFPLTSSLTTYSFIGRKFYDFLQPLQGTQVGKRASSNVGRNPVGNKKKHNLEVNTVKYTKIRYTHLMSILSDDDVIKNPALSIKDNVDTRKTKMISTGSKKQQRKKLTNSSVVSKRITTTTTTKSLKNNSNNTTLSMLPTMKEKKTKQKKAPNKKSTNTNSTDTISSSQDYFWINPRDYVLMDSSQSQSIFHCTIRGPPQPLKRHRSGNQGFQRRHMYNPSAVAQKSFQKAIRHCCSSDLTSLIQTDMISHDTEQQKQEQHPLVPNNDDDNQQASNETRYLFEGPIRMTLHFYMPRPKSHYRNHQPGKGRLKHNAPMLVQRKVDVDNLAKFVLDSLNGILYEDDHQIVSLCCSKCYHDDDDDDDENNNALLTLPFETEVTENCGKTVLWLQSLSDNQDIQGCMKSPMEFTLLKYDQ
jgi:Endodeoxyribonuclease RusA